MNNDVFGNHHVMSFAGSGMPYSARILLLNQQVYHPFEFCGMSIPSHRVAWTFIIFIVLCSVAIVTTVVGRVYL